MDILDIRYGASQAHFLGASIYLHGDKIETLAVAQPGTAHPTRLAWAKDAAVKQLLDVVALILTEEYVRTIKPHPETFSRNDDLT